MENPYRSSGMGYKCVVQSGSRRKIKNRIKKLIMKFLKKLFKCKHDPDLIMSIENVRTRERTKKSKNTYNIGKMSEM